MIVVRRCYVTLLELLVVIAILSLIAGVMVIGIDKVIVDQRFRTEVSVLVDELRLAQDLMMIMGVDVKMQFAPDDTGINYWLEIDSELPKDLLKQVQKKQRLRTVRGVFFNNLNEEEHGKLDLNFLSRGAVMSQGILQLTITGEQEETNSRVLQNFICLSGYPRPISSSDSYEAAEKLCFAAEDENLAKALTYDTFDKLPEKMRNPSGKEVEQKESEQGNPSETSKSSKPSEKQSKSQKKP